MITSFLITQHQKALNILLMIEKATTCNRAHKHDIAELNKLEVWHPYRDNIVHHQDRIKRNEAIIERLTGYYVRLMKKYNDVIMTKSIAA